MIPSFLHLTRPKAQPDLVEDVEVHVPVARNPAVERLLVLGWTLIVLKSAFVWWAWWHFPIPFHPMWLVGPSVAFGCLCTFVYWLRIRR